MDEGHSDRTKWSTGGHVLAEGMGLGCEKVYLWLGFPLESAERKVLVKQG